MRESQGREETPPTPPQTQHLSKLQALQQRLLKVGAAATDGRRETSRVPGSTVTNVLHREARWTALPLASRFLKETLGCFSCPGSLQAPSLPSPAKG